MASSKTTNKTSKKVEEVKKEAVVKSTALTSELEEKNKNLENELESLKAQMALMLKTMAAEKKVEISSETDIPVISMCNWVLNLTTEPMGAGNIYRFSHFGEEQLIPKDDLKRIIKVNNRFIKEGLAYIADEEFIKNERLASAYKKIADIDTLKSLLDADRESFKTAFSSLPTSQQDVLIDLICRKLIDDKDIDMNIVSICETVTQRKLLEEVQEAKEVLKDIKK